MMLNLGHMISFLGKATKDHSKEIAKLLQDKAWHQKCLDTALREAMRGHSRNAIIQNHQWAIKAIDAALKRLA